MTSFINVFTKYLSKTWRKRCHILTQNFKIHFNMYVLLRHNAFLYLKFCVLFCSCHHYLFNVSLLYLFINVFTRYFSKTSWKRCCILIKIPTFCSTCMYLCIKICFYMYLSIPSSLLAEGTANTCWILLQNDGKSRRWRIKKQSRYERLHCNASLVIPVCYGKVRQGPGGLVPGRIFKDIYWKLIVPS